MDRLYKGVWEKVRSGSVISRGLFQFAYEYKHRAIERGYEVPIMNKYVLNDGWLDGFLTLCLQGAQWLSGRVLDFRP